MKLVRYGQPGRERPGVWLDDTPETGRASLLDVRSMAYDIADFDGAFFARRGLDRLRALLAEGGRKLIPADGVRLGPPVARPAKILCLGRNFLDHALEFGGDGLPERPVVFSKAVTALAGPHDPLVLPDDAEVVDGEVELALVIGRGLRNAEEAEAMEAVAGYCVLNDITDRVAQRAGKQWFCGKGRDGFCPMGPYLVTRDEVLDPYALTLKGGVSGRVLQEAQAGDMHFRIEPTLAYLSRHMTLEPGDVVSMGTPGGIGSARDPRVLLRAGDTAEAEIDRLGRQACKVV